MKRLSSILKGALVIYLTINILGKVVCVNNINPFVRFLNNIQYRCRSTKTPPTRDEVEARMGITWPVGMSWGIMAWPYDVSLVGTHTIWTLKFEPKPATLWRRAWFACAFWDFDPQARTIYQMDSRTMVWTMSGKSIGGKDFFHAVPPYWDFEKSDVPTKGDSGKQ